MKSTESFKKKNIHQETILVVDDVIQNLQLLNEMLHSTGIKVRSAQSAEQALQTMKNHSYPDLMLVDIKMPGMSGLELCQKLKNNPETHDIPIIICSSKDDKATVMEGYKLGAVDYITKPFDVDVVLAKINAQLKAYRLKKDLEEKNNDMQCENRARECAEIIMQHDLKAPLNAFFSLPEMIKRRGTLTEKQQKLLDIIEESGHKMYELINQASQIRNLEKGRYNYKPQQIDIVNQCKNIIEFFSTLATNLKKKISFDNKAGVEEQNSVFILGDKVLNYCMICNLLKNALEASRDAETIQITLNRTETIDLTIHNSTPVPEEIKDHFFDKYATSGKPKGTGIGTYSAKLSAEAQGAKIDMQSSSEIGTKITIRYPKQAV